MYYTSEEENYRKYGIVILEVYDETLRATVYHYRKPTPSERKEIILNHIIDNSGTPIKVNYLSSKLAVSDRTIQKIVKELVSEKNKIVTRLNTIDSIIIRLYEDLVEEKLSGSNYQKMLDKYQNEQKKLNSQLIEIESKLTQENKTEDNIETFKQIARKYIDFDELTPEIINNLISHITVSHVKVINGTKFREIKIIYKFIG